MAHDSIVWTSPYAHVLRNAEIAAGDGRTCAVIVRRGSFVSVDFCDPRDADVKRRWWINVLHGLSTPPPPPSFARYLDELTAACRHAGLDVDYAEAGGD